MAIARERQPSFAAGELAPGMYGRTDHVKYGSGCRTALNFFVSPHGGLVSRAGTEMIGQIPGAANGVRLVPFVFSDTDTLLLVFVTGRVYVYAYDSDTGRVAPVLDGSTRVSVATPEITAASLPKLRFSQVGDVILVVGRSATMFHELRRTSADNTAWEWELATFGAESFPYWGGTPRIHGVPSEDPDNPEWTYKVTRICMDADGSMYETAPYTLNQNVKWNATEWSGAISYGVGQLCWVGSTFYVATVASGPTEQRYPPTHVGSYWDVATVSEFETRTFYPCERHFLVGAANPKTISWFDAPAYDAGTPAGVDSIVATRVYRGSGDLFGLVGQTDGDSFTDAVTDPDYTIRPPSDLNPFEKLTEDLESSYWDYPTLVTWMDNRRVVACTSEKPAAVWGSRVSAIRDFDTRPPVTDDAPWNVEISSRRWEAVRAIVARQGLIIFTDNGEWLLAGSGENEAVTPLSMVVRPISQFGCSSVEPLSVNQAVLFVQRKGTVVRALFETGPRSYQAQDISVWSRHLFAESAIVDWCFAEDPWSTIWVVKDDGSILSCTFLPEQELVAWTRHEIQGADEVLAVASVPEGREDAVYFAVERNGLVYLERMATRVVEDVRTAICLDAAEHYDGRNTDATSTVAVHSDTGGERYTSCEVTVVGEAVAGENVGRILRVHGPEVEDEDDPANTVLVKLITHSGGGVYVGTLLEDLPSDMDAEAYAEWSVCATSVVVSHLVGRPDVYAMVDGSLLGPIDLKTASYSLGADENAAEIVTVGLGYNSDFESLDSLQGRERSRLVRKVWLEMEAARGGWVGQDLETLHEIPFRTVDHAWEPIPLTTGEFETLVTGSYGYHGRVAYRSLGVPVTILGVIRELEVGG